jgi:hypothetical protein
LLRAKLESVGWQRFGVILMVGLALVGILARLAPIVAHHFHQDEAIYSHWALQVTTGRDPWLSRFPVDKPPLFIYVLALFFNLFGPSESVARLPSELASAVSLFLVYLLARRLWGHSTAFIALALMALSPLNILFAPTAFTDPLMTSLVLAALCAAAYRRWGWSGGLLGLAFICKPQAVIFLPLAVAFGSLAERRRPESAASSPSAAGSGRLRAGLAVWPPPVSDGLFFVASFGAAVAPAFIWDALRAQRPGFLEQSAISYGGLAWAPAAQWVERAGQWRAILAYVTASPLLDAVLVGGTLVLLAYDWLGQSDDPRAGRRTRTDLALVAFAVFFLAVHVVVNFNVWDRYMLPLVPCLCLLLARVLTLPLELSAALAIRMPRIAPLRPACGIALAALLVLTTLRPAQDASAGRYPIGGDHGAYDGLTELVAYFRGHVPGGSIVYHEWLGWHFSFYMFDFPYQFQWYTTPEELAAHAAAHAGSPRFVAFPSWTSSTPVAWRLKQAGLALQPVYETYREDGSASFTLYRIEENAP